MKCLVKDCKNTSLLMTVELCYPCSQLVEQGQREWVGLTDAEMESIWDITPPEYQDRFAFARAVEAKLKDKNTCR